MQHPHAGLVLPQPPARDMGGHGLYSTVGGYLKFIRMPAIRLNRWVVARRYAGLLDAALARSGLYEWN
ncbi:hypothetical protein C2U69_23400 [Cupriavidus pinatubonensis]|nr:hypothetical protein C2U69_23400 [Cupriavidus pinatubonensis]